MMASAFLIFFGLGAICWLMFTLAVFALPFWIGLVTSFWLHGSGHGVLVAIIGGLVSAGLIAAFGEIAFARIRSVPVRLVLGLVYAVPAGLAGFHATKGLAALTGAGETAGVILAGFGALTIGGTAWARIAGWSQADGLSENGSGDGGVATHR